MRDIRIEAVEKKGFLIDQYKIFYLKDQKKQSFEFHSHPFHKLIVFLSGQVSYVVEGRTYDLEPWDILLVRDHDIHKPEISPAVPYERLVIWIHEDSLKALGRSGENLCLCFDQVLSRKDNRLRFNEREYPEIVGVVNQLIHQQNLSAFGSASLQEALLVQFFVYLSRLSSNPDFKDPKQIQLGDKRLLELLEYINDHVTADLSVEHLSAISYLSRYYLMHQFKRQTGLTLHAYVSNKRLKLANGLIKDGLSMTEAAYQSGFRDYSTFLRAYKKLYGLSPRMFYSSAYQLMSGDLSE